MKCHLCKSKQGILIYFFFSNDLAFRKTAVSKTRDIPSSQQGERVLTVASFSMYSSGAPREARPISCNGRETGTDMAGVCCPSALTLRSHLVFDHRKGIEWLDTFRRAQVHSNCFVKASLTTLHRVTDLENGGSLVLYSLYKREHRGTEERDDLLTVTW